MPTLNKLLMIDDDDDDDEKHTQRIPNFLPSINILCFFLIVYFELLSNENCKAKIVLIYCRKRHAGFENHVCFCK